MTKTCAALFCSLRILNGEKLRRSLEGFFLHKAKKSYSRVMNCLKYFAPAMVQSVASTLIFWRSTGKRLFVVEDCRTSLIFIQTVQLVSMMRKVVAL